MKLLGIAFLLLPSLGAAQDIPAAAVAAKTSAAALVAHQEAAWNAADAHAWAADYADDADFVNILGAIFHGRAEIEHQHAAIFSGPYKGSHLKASVRSFKLLSQDVALVDADLEVTRFRGLPPGITPTRPDLLATRMKYVVLRHGSSWEFIAAQNTVVLPAPQRP